MIFLVYKVTNTVNGKIYIGAHRTNNVNDSYMGTGKLILKAHKKYGIDKFTKEILYTFESEEEMYAKEAELVTEEFVSLESNYNLDIGGKGGTSRSKEVRSKISANHARHNLGKTMSEESKAKLSVSHKGKSLSEEHKEAIGNSVRGIKRSQEFKDKLSAHFSGVPRTEEDKESMRQAFLNTPDKVCPHCGISCKPSPFKRWHGDNCKQFTGGNK